MNELILVLSPELSQFQLLAVLAACLLYACALEYAIERRNKKQCKYG